jgi:hypothetical protein
MSMASDIASGTLLVGTSNDSFHLFKVNNSPTPLMFINSHDSHLGPTVVTAIKVVSSNNYNSLYVCSLANGMVKLFTCV